MNRSTFSENYPRKFARRLASIMCKIQAMKKGIYHPPECLTFAAEHPSVPAKKRPRLCQTYHSKFSRARGVETLQWGIRRKCTGKTQAVDTSLVWRQIFDIVKRDYSQGW